MTSALFEARTDAAMRKLEELDEPTFREYVVDEILHKVFAKRAFGIDDAFRRRQDFLKYGPNSGRLHSGWEMAVNVTDGHVFFGQEQMTELHAAVELSAKPQHFALIMREIELLMHRFAQCAIIYRFVYDEQRIVPYCSWRTLYELDREVSFVRAFYLNTEEELAEREIDRTIADVVQTADANDLALGLTHNEREFYVLDPGRVMLNAQFETERDAMFDSVTMRIMPLYRFNAVWLYARHKEYLCRPGTESFKWSMAIPVFHAPDEVRAHNRDIDATLAWWLQEYEPFLWPHVAEMLAPTDDGHLRFSLRLVRPHSNSHRFLLFGFMPATDAPLPRELTGVALMMPVADHATNYRSERRRGAASAFYSNSGMRAPMGCNFLKEMAGYAFNGFNGPVRVYRGPLASTGWYLPMEKEYARAIPVLNYTLDRAQITPTLSSSEFSIDANEIEEKEDANIIVTEIDFVNIPQPFRTHYGDAKKRHDAEARPTYVVYLTHILADLTREKNKDDMVQRALEKLSNSQHYAYDDEIVCVARVEGREYAEHDVDAYNGDIERLLREHGRSTPASRIAFLKSIFEIDSVREYLISLADENFQTIANAPDYQDVVDQIVRMVTYASSNTIFGQRWSARASEKPSYSANMLFFEAFLAKFVRRWFNFNRLGIFMTQQRMDRFIDDARVAEKFDRLFVFHAQRRLVFAMRTLVMTNPNSARVINELQKSLAAQLGTLGPGLERYGEKYDTLVREAGNDIGSAANQKALLDELLRISREFQAIGANTYAKDAIDVMISDRILKRPKEDIVMMAIDILIASVLPTCANVAASNDALDDAACVLTDDCKELIRAGRFVDAAQYIRSQQARTIDEKTILALLDMQVNVSDRDKTVMFLTPLIRQLSTRNGTVPREEAATNDRLLDTIVGYFARNQWQLPPDPRWIMRTLPSPSPSASQRVPASTVHMSALATGDAFAPIATASASAAASDEHAVSERTRMRRARIRSVVAGGVETDTGAASAAPVSYDTLFFDFVMARQNGEIGDQFLEPLKRFSLTTPHAHRLIEDISRRRAIDESFAENASRERRALYARFLNGTEYGRRILHTRWPVVGGRDTAVASGDGGVADTEQVRDAAYDFILRINDEIFKNTCQPRSPAARATLSNNREMLLELGFTREAEFLDDPMLARDRQRWRDAYMTPERIEGGMRAARACLLDEGGLDFLLLTNVIPLDTDEAELRYELIARLGGSAEQYGVYV